MQPTDKAHHIDVSIVHNPHAVKAMMGDKDISISQLSNYEQKGNKIADFFLKGLYKLIGFTKYGSSKKELFDKISKFNANLSEEVKFKGKLEEINKQIEFKKNEDEITKFKKLVNDHQLNPRDVQVKANLKIFEGSHTGKKGIQGVKDHINSLEERNKKLEKEIGSQLPMKLDDLQRTQQKISEDVKKFAESVGRLWTGQIK